MNHIVIKKAGIERVAIGLITTSMRLFARYFPEVFLSKAKIELEITKVTLTAATLEYNVVEPTNYIATGK